MERRSIAGCCPLNIPDSLTKHLITRFFDFTVAVERKLESLRVEVASAVEKRGKIQAKEDFFGNRHL